jgi:hypothetical protein
MEKIACYDWKKSTESLILEPEDWTEAEWATLLKLFGMEEAERIVVKDYILETYGIKKERTEA